MNPAPSQPLYFGPDAGRLFGRLHRPATPGSQTLARVLCNPFGFEDVGAHRAMRDMAQAAATAGIAALRFDYPDTGHSSDVDDEQAARWPRWVIFTAGAGLAAAGVVSVVAAWSAVWHLT